MSLAKPPPQTAALSEYLCYLAMLQGGNLLSFYPSEIAFSSLILAVHTVDEEDHLCTDFLAQSLQSMADSMPEKHVGKGTPAKEELKRRLNECMSQLLDLHQEAAYLTQKAVCVKFSKFKYLNVAELPCLSSPPVLN